MSPIYHKHNLNSHYKIETQTLTRKNNGISLHLQYPKAFVKGSPLFHDVFITAPRVIVQATGGLLFNGVLIVPLTFMFHILYYDPACVQLQTAAYDTIDPGSRYPACGVVVFIDSHKAVYNSKLQDTLRLYLSFSIVEDMCL